MENNNTKIRLTESGVEELQRKISFLKRKIAQHEASMERAIELFGMHDEQYYDRLQRKTYREQELAQLEYLLKSSQILEDEQSDHVEIGNRVKLSNHMICYQFQVVSSLEADPALGKVSDSSPVGASILGKRVGDQVKIALPKGEIELVIEVIE